MRKILLLLPVIGFLAGCTDLTDNQVVGTTGGAVLGAIVTPHNPLQGALMGGAVGLVAGTYMGRDAAGKCIYQRDDGSRYYAACP